MWSTLETKNKGILGSRCDTKYDVKSCAFTWTIDHYSILCRRPEGLESAPFTADDDDFKWRLQQSFLSTNEGIVTFRLRADSNEELKRHIPLFGNVEISVVKPDGSKIDMLKFDFEFTSDEMNTCKELSAFDVNRLKNMTFRNTLTIFCNVNYLKKDSVISTLICSNSVEVIEPGLSHDLERVLIDERFSDATISVKGKNYPVHKVILAARSSVFYSMLSSGMQESQKSQITITDIDQEIFEEMLHYIYTGKTKNLEVFAFEMLPVANKYDLKELKIMCGEILAKNLSTENAARILILADMHHAEKLKAHTLRFVRVNCANCEDFKNTEIWNILTTSRPQLMKDMLAIFFEK